MRFTFLFSILEHNQTNGRPLQDKLHHRLENGWLQNQQYTGTLFISCKQKIVLFLLLSKINCETFLQTCQRYCLQKDITRECQCFHPNLVVAMVNSTFDKRPCLITPDKNSKIHTLYINTRKHYLLWYFSDTDYVCIQNVQKLHENLTIQCPCHVSCK